MFGEPEKAAGHLRRGLALAREQVSRGSLGWLGNRGRSRQHARPVLQNRKLQ